MYELIKTVNCFQNNEEQEFEQFVSGFLNPDSGKLVKPAPGVMLLHIFSWSFQICISYLYILRSLLAGLCIKTFKTDDHSKVFINLCHHADIPAPEDITKEELIEVLGSKDPGRFCVPLSIGIEHEENIKGKIYAFFNRLFSLLFLCRIRFI